MEAQQTLVEPETMPVEAGEPPVESAPSSSPSKRKGISKVKSAVSGDAAGNPKLKLVNRNRLITVDLERSLELDHPARAILDLMKCMDFDQFFAAIRTQQGEKGRPSNDPRILASVWLYAYSQGISAAREIERQMGYEPGLTWL